MQPNEDYKEKKVIRILFRQYKIFRHSTGLQKVCWSSYVCMNVNKAAKRCVYIYIHTHSHRNSSQPWGLSFFNTMLCVRDDKS